MTNNFEFKTCDQCNIIKTLDEFYFRNDSKKYRRICKCCFNITQKKYKINNIEKIKESKIKYAKENKEKINEYKQEYNINNKEKISEYHKKRNVLNKDKNKEYRKKYYKDNKSKIDEKNKTYINNNKEKIKTYKNDYFKKRKFIDPLFKLIITIRSSIRGSLTRCGYSKKSRTYDILGCSYDEFKLYIESKFEYWMNWENRGLYNGELNYGWDIDHIIPISSAITEEDVIKLNHYSNLQPLCGYDNRHIKRDNF